MDETLSGMIKRYKDLMGSNTVTDNNYYTLCNCIGPKDGEPLCPCRMKNVKVQDGRYIEVIDHGPVKSTKEE